MKAIGVPAIAVNLDIAIRAGLEPAVERVERELGGIDILVNNAGNVSLSGGVLNETPEEWDNVIETQLNAVFLLSELAARTREARLFCAVSFLESNSSSSRQTASRC